MSPESTGARGFLKQRKLFAHKYSTFDTICVERMTIRSFAKELIRLRKRTRSFGSSPVVGSSRIRIRGSFSMAWAIPSRLFIPPEKLLIRCRPSASSPTSSKSSFDFFLADFSFNPFKAATYSKKSNAVKSG